jgi:hypothetical protein
VDRDSIHSRFIEFFVFVHHVLEAQRHFSGAAFRTSPARDCSIWFSFKICFPSHKQGNSNRA